MEDKAFHIHSVPDLKEPAMIMGVEGWGNALGVSSGMVSYLIRKLEAKSFAGINTDLFYRYDENRPVVRVEKGNLETISFSGGTFYYVQGDTEDNSQVLLHAREPNLRWIHFSKEIAAFCDRLGVRTLIVLGSMYDNVLHSDRIISGFASTPALTSFLEDKGISPVNYEGPSAIHSFLYLEAENLNIPCITLWCHCPYYLEGATHFGLLSHLGRILASLAHFTLDTEELDNQWKDLNQQIQSAINNNKQLQQVIEEVRKAKREASRTSRKGMIKKDQKVIPISDFFKQR